MRAITTKFFGPTDFQGSRIRATDGWTSKTIPYSHELSVDKNHRAAATAFAKKNNWSGTWAQGSIKEQQVFVCIDASYEIFKIG